MSSRAHIISSPIRVFQCPEDKLSRRVKRIAKALRDTYSRKQGLQLHIFKHRDGGDVHAYVVHTEDLLPDDRLIHFVGFDRIMIRPLYQAKGDF